MWFKEDLSITSKKMADQHQLYTILHSIYAGCVHNGVEDQSVLKFSYF